MKKSLLYILFILLPGSILAQAEALPTQSDLEHFLTTKTYVVLEDSPFSDYNFEVEEIMSKVWNITEFEFIKMSEFSEMSQDPNKSFLYTSLVSFEKDKTDSRYFFLHLSLGGENLTMDDLLDLCSLPLGYFGVDQDRYMYKLGVFLQFMQNHVKLLIEKPELISNNVFKHYNDNIKDAHNKTLYLLEEELAKEVSTAARIKKVYPFKFRLVEPEQIKEAILSNDESVVFLHKVGPEGKKLKARTYKIIIGAGDAKFYYFDYHMNSDKKPDGFLESDFKKLAK